VAIMWAARESTQELLRGPTRPDLPSSRDQPLSLGHGSIAPILVHWNHLLTYISSAAAAETPLRFFS